MRLLRRFPRLVSSSTSCQASLGAQISATTCATCSRSAVDMAWRSGSGSRHEGTTFPTPLVWNFSIHVEVPRLLISSPSQIFTVSGSAAAAVVASERRLLRLPLLRQVLCRAMSPSDNLDGFSVVSMLGSDDPISQLEQHIGFVATSSGPHVEDFPNQHG